MRDSRVAVVVRVIIYFGARVVVGADTEGFIMTLELIFLICHLRADGWLDFLVLFFFVCFWGKPSSYTCYSTLQYTTKQHKLYCIVEYITV